MIKVEQDAWNSYVSVVKDFLFLWKYKSTKLYGLVETMFAKFQALGARMNIKLQYLFCHLNHFPKNLGNMSEEQEERFHQNIKVMQERYQGRWDTHMMTDYCWCLMRDCSQKNYKRKSKRTFLQMSSS